MGSALLVIDASSTLNFNLLTKHRVPAAIPFLGRYRIIDVPLSNAKASGITNVGVFTGFNYRSLQDHIGSGSRYGLDRRKDGIFLLPPKNETPAAESFLSFQKMKEQDEFFRRSSQEYAIITPSTLVWSIDYNELVNNHIKSGKDITEVITDKKQRLFTFIISKEKLMNYIDSHTELDYRNMVEVFDYSNHETKNTYVFNGQAKYIRDENDYYKVSIAVLSDASRDRNFYSALSKLKTKEQLDSPVFYGSHSEVNHSLISSGAHIHGKVENSLISRRVRVGNGAVIKNSIIMNSCVIEDGAIIENSIIDKNTLVKKNSVVKGTFEEPFISEKRQIVYSSAEPKVAIITAECMPFIKRGGLADMVGSLSLELSKIGADVKVFIPFYKEIKDNHLNSFDGKKELIINVNNNEYHINVYYLEKEKITYYFIDLYMFFDRRDVYGYIDDAYRFSYFTYAVMEFLSQNNIPIDIFHIHDWHTCMLPLFKKKYNQYESSTTLLTIHNLNYRGEADKSIIDHFNLDYYIPGAKTSFLEIGINSVDQITTVSKTYAEELKYAYYSGNLQEAIIRRSSSIHGIVNGLNSDFNPQHDLDIKAQYSIKNVFSKKEINKEFLANLCGFEYSKDMFIIGSVSRIDEIKGFDLIINSLYTILENKNIYFVLLGVGDERIMNDLRKLESSFPHQVKCFLDFYGTKPSYIYSGSDVFLMPSRIEPCGTSQMIALKYGTVPVVRQTGGLNDTIDSFDYSTFCGNGFKFYNSDPFELISTMKNVYNVYKDNKDAWKKLVKNGMKCDNSFSRCAKEYLNLYNSIRKIGSNNEQ